MMSDISLMLDEQLSGMGFATQEEAEQAGFVAVYGRDNNGELYARWEKKHQFDNSLEELELELAHLEWEQETNAKKIEELKKAIKEIKGE